MEKSFQDGRFHCYYTGLELTPLRRADPLFLHFDHPTPGDQDKLVVAAALVNLMKSNLTAAGFKTMVRALHLCFEGQPFDRDALPDWNEPPRAWIPCGQCIGGECGSCDDGWIHSHGQQILCQSCRGSDLCQACFGQKGSYD